jgi:hypothetical protein
LVAGAAHDGGGPAPESDSTVDVTAADGVSPRIKTATWVTSSQTQMGAAATPPDDNDNECEVMMGHPCLQAPKLTSLPEVVGMA